MKHRRTFGGFREFISNRCGVVAILAGLLVRITLWDVIGVRRSPAI